MSEHKVDNRYTDAAGNMEVIMSRLCEDTGFDYETAVYVLGIYLEQTESIVNEINELLLSEVENNKEVSTRNQLARLLHKLKGASGNVRALEMMEKSKLAEEACQNKDQDQLISVIHEINCLVERYLS